MESEKANNPQNNQNMNIAIGGTLFFPERTTYK